jgi:ABC-type nitrate/sulfonate/bicarbonate transport system substrate-binding protein
MSTRRVLAVVVMLAALAVAWADPAAAQEPVKVKIQRLNFPSMVTMMTDVVKAQGLDRKHGIDLEPKSYGAISAYYAAIATGEVDIGVGGPHVLQKMRNEGVPIMVGFTYTRLSALGLVTGQPGIRSIADLKGKSIAADMGSSEYQILSIYGRNQGIVLGRDVTVVQAGPPLARSQLQAKRVEAALTFEPSLTLLLRDDPQYRVLVKGDTAWKSVAKADGWQLVVLFREDFVKRSPEAIPRLLRMFREGQEFIRANVDEADRVVQGTVKLPPGVFKESVVSGRLVYDVQPAWEPEHRQAIWDMFKIAVDSRYLDRLPDEGAIYKP